MARLASPPIGPAGIVEPGAVVSDSALGEYTRVGARAVVLSSELDGYARVGDDSMLTHAELGRFASVSTRCRIGPVDHPHHRPALHVFTYQSALYGMGEDDRALMEERARIRTRLGPDSLVSHGAVILAGVEVGAGAIVGASAVVSRDVPPFAVVVGAPARVVRFRFPEAEREALLRLAWWNWPRARLVAALEDFRRLPVLEFCAKHGAA